MNKYQYTDEGSQLRYLYSGLGIEPEIAKRFTLDILKVTDGNKEAIEYAKACKEKIGFLTFMGETGRGKTHLALAIANQHIVSFHRNVKYYQVPDLLEQMRRNFSTNERELLEDAKTAHLLVLDDFGMEKTTEWALEQLDSLVDYRYIRQMDTIFTTNKKISDLSPRIASRLSSGRIIQLKGIDYRVEGK